MKKILWISALLAGMTIFLGLAPQRAQASALVKPPNNLGLVGYWSFEDGAGSTATDFSGKGHKGTLTNFALTGATSTWVTGKLGKALNFDGTNDYVDVTRLSGSYSSISSAYSVAFWVKGLSSTSDTLFAELNTATTTQGFRIASGATGTGKLAISIVADNGSLLRSASTNLVALDNTWHHVVWTDTAGTTKFYIDAVADTANVSYTPGANTLTLDTSSIACRRSVTVSSCWDGSIDDVRIYNRALSATEVASLYNSGGIAKSNASLNGFMTSGLVGLWSFDGADVSGTTVYDRSGQGNNGVMTNGPTTAGGKIGQALNFDGVDDIVDAGSPGTLDNMTELTYSAWVNILGQPENGLGRIIVKDVSGGDLSGIGLMFNYSYGFNNPVIEGRVDFDTTDARSVSQNLHSIYGAGVSYKGGWFHVAMTYSVTTAEIKLYFNGVEAAYQVQTAGEGTQGDDSAGKLFFGNSTFGSRSFKGALDDIRVYDRMLSATEVLQLYRLGSAGVNRSMAGAPGTSNLVLWHTFDGPRLNTTTSTDSSGQGNNGTLVGGPAPVTGKIGQGLKFVGDTSAWVAGTTTINPSVVTLSAWVKLNVNNANEIIVAKNNVIGAGAGNSQYAMWVSSAGKLSFLVSNGTTKKSMAGGTTLDTNTWYFVSGVFDGTNINVYVNGVSDATPVATGYSTLNSSGARLYIGSDANRGTPSDRYPMDGVIDDLRIYDRGLTAAEILQLYNSTK